jgi:hypothetical protein
MQLILDGQINARIDSHNKVRKPHSNWKLCNIDKFEFLRKVADILQRLHLLCGNDISFQSNLTDWNVLSDFICKRYRSEKLHVWEVFCHGEGVPTTHKSKHWPVKMRWIFV